MKCEKCHSELSPGARFCNACGHPVAAAGAPASSPDSIACPSCGAKQPAGERFCSECGQPLQDASPPPRTPSSTPEPTSAAAPIAGAQAKPRRWLRPLAIAAGIAVLGLGWVGFQEFSEKRLRDSLVHGEIATVKSALAAGRDPNKPFRGEARYTPLIVASMFGHAEIIKALIAAGANVNVQDVVGATPLYHAAFKGDADAVRELLAHGADANLKNSVGGTPLGAARVAERQGWGKAKEVIALLQNPGAVASASPPPGVAGRPASAGTPAPAGAIEGTVSEASGKTATVVTQSGLLPSVGDKVDIFFRVPGTTDEISVGSGRVSSLSGDSIQVTIEQATGEVAKDHLARFHSETPTRRGEAPAPAS